MAAHKMGVMHPVGAELPATEIGHIAINLRMGGAQQQQLGRL
jgi:hypothetical protein